jgi:hypothetical protein
MRLPMIALNIKSMQSLAMSWYSCNTAELIIKHQINTNIGNVMAYLPMTLSMIALI